MRKQELSAFSMILVACVLGSVTTISFSGCKPPTAVPRSSMSTEAKYKDAYSNMTGSNLTASNMTASAGAVEWSSNVTNANSNVTASGNMTVAAETPLAKTPLAETPLAEAPVPAAPKVVKVEPTEVVKTAPVMEVVKAEPAETETVEKEAADAKPAEMKPAESKPAEAVAAAEPEASKPEAKTEPAGEMKEAAPAVVAAAVAAAATVESDEKEIAEAGEKKMAEADPATSAVKEETPKAAAEPEAKMAAKPETPKSDSPEVAEEKDVVAATSLAVAEFAAPEDIVSAGGDWPQWGGTRLRNNVANVKGLPQDWNIGKFDRRTGAWDKSKKVNVAWKADLGSQTYGNPVVAGGRVFVGTNNGAGHLKRFPAQVDLGCLLAFDEKKGDFLWQHSSEKLITGRVHDWPLQGICCSPLVEGNRLWFVTSRGEVRCLDVEGYYDGEDNGPVTGETAKVATLLMAKTGGPSVKALGEGKIADELADALKASNEEISGEVTVESIEEGSKWKLTGTFNGVDRELTAKKEGPKLLVFKTLGVDDKRDADTIWIFNMMKQLDTSQHNMCSCSVTSYGDYLFVNTSNGLDESHLNLPAPEAPTFICLNKNTGELLWQDSSPGTNILHGQWSSPTVAVLGGVAQALFCGGDGWLYSFKADGGKDGKGELLWKFDCNPKESKWVLGGEGTRNNLIATPVIYNDLVYIAVGQDPEHGEGEGHFWCIDPTKRGNVSPELAMKVEGDDRVEIPHKRIQAVEPEKGEIAVDNPNSAVVWHYALSDANEDGEIDFEEEMHRTIGTCAIKDDVLYVADFSGLLHCLDARGDNGEAKVHFTYDMLAQSWGSPLIADGHVYVGDEDGDVAVFQFGPQYNDPKVEIQMGSSVYSTPIAANGRIYISTKDKLFAIEKEE